MYNYTNYISRTDRFGSIVTEESDIQILCSKLKYPVEDILKAIQEVGYDQEEIEEYIRDRYNRSI